MIELLIGALLFAIVAAFVLVPLRRARTESREDPRLADLESRKEAKYREIRDTELDHAAGKLSEEDFRRQDAELRAEAIEILKHLDKVKPDQGGGSTDGEAS